MGKKYIEKTINSNETIEMQCHVHWMCIVPRLIIVILVTSLFTLSNNGEILNDVSYYQGVANVLNPYMILLIAVINIAILWKPIISIFTIELGFTDKRVIYKFGLFKVTTVDIPLNKINSIHVSTGFLGDVFGYGKIKISTSSDSYTLLGIAEVEEFKNHLMWQIDHYEKKQLQRISSMMINQQGKEAEE